jgi:poly-gamma-glutamate capsule biosynthesis protein CapA/YwtB (metallophosphatase superfamily)
MLIPPGHRVSKRLPPAIALMGLLLAGCVLAADASDARHTVLADFESGTATLTSFEDEDQNPNDWSIQSSNTYDDSDYALRLWGNTWKELALTPYPVVQRSVFQAALFVEERGELHAVGFGDEEGNILYYCVSGTQVVLSDSWNIVNQGAFPIEEWHAYRFRIGQDWFDTWGYLPVITRVIFVNDRDQTMRGATVFDELYDATDELPIAPLVQIQPLIGAVRTLAEEAAPGVPLYRVEVQFQSLVSDPDSPTHTYAWDFGDGATSTEANPSHAFTATADYTFTVALDVTDETGLVGRDTCQVAVEPGGSSSDFTVNFVGDVFTGRTYEQPGGLIDTYGIEYLWEPTLPMLGQAADVTVANTECAYTDRGTPHPTKSVVFRTRPENVAGLVFAGIDVATLGNNHIVDYGLEGLLQTQAVFDSVGLVRAGSGVNEYFALQPAYCTQAGVRLGLISACNRTGRQYGEQPFLDAGYDKCGFGYWLEPNLERAIAQADSLADIVIACPHSGEEYELAPPDRRGADGKRFDIENGPPFTPSEDAPEVIFRIWPGASDRELRRRAIECGADAVINHHPHVLQGFEVYQGKLIAHSLGNFMFDLSYAETLPTLVLTGRMDKDRVRGWTFRPVFIDNLIPRPASGRLGREILDRMADYSRVLGCTVGVDPGTLTGTIYLDPLQAEPEVTESAGTAALVAAETGFVSHAIELAGQGSLSRIVSASGVPAGSEVRVGREILWFGRFEQDEGYHMWNLNSSDETLVGDTFFEGAHALRLHRDDHDPENVVTLLDRHLPAADSLDYGITGWMKTMDANQAEFGVRFFTSRYTWNPLATFGASEPVSGTTDWTWCGADFTAPEGANYLNVRCNLNVPDNNDAFAWFDDLRVIEWEPWQPLDLPLTIPSPNNLRFLEVRSPLSGDSVAVVYEETALFDAAFSGYPEGTPGPPAQLRLMPAAPNPFRGETILRYQLGASARVQLEVFDVSGRLVTRLARGETQRPGWHAVSWQAPAQRAGVYFARLSAGGEVHTRKLVVVR